MVTSVSQWIQLSLEDLQVEDPNHNFPYDHSLIVLEGDNYTLAGLIITPFSGYSGILSIPVKVSDCIGESKVFNLEIEVEAVLGIDQWEEAYQIYPIPSKYGIINVTGLPKGSQFELIDLKGNIRKSGIIQNDIITITELKGVFILHISTKNGFDISKKVIFVNWSN